MVPAPCCWPNAQCPNCDIYVNAFPIPPCLYMSLFVTSFGFLLRFLLCGNIYPLCYCGSLHDLPSQCLTNSSSPLLFSPPLSSLPLSSPLLSSLFSTSKTENGKGVKEKKMELIYAKVNMANSSNTCYSFIIPSPMLSVNI